MSISGKTHELIFGSLVLAFSLAGCLGSASTPAPAEPVVAAERAEEEAPLRLEAGKEMSEPALARDDAAGAPAEEAMAEAMADEAVVETEVAMAEAPVSSYGATEGGATTDLATEAPARAESTTVEIQQSTPLRAGEVDDNAQWDDYLLYRRNYAGPVINDRDISERYLIEVNDGQGRPVLGAEVSISIVGQQQAEEIYQARTYANGQILFHPLALGLDLAQIDRFQVDVRKDDLVAEFSFPRFEAQSSGSFTEKWTVNLDQSAQAEPINLDILFLIDATGSMADEINKIQNTIFDVSAQIDALPGRPEARYGMVTYRDRGDSFVSNTYEFTPDVREFHQNLSGVFADGGGDYPESLNEGLHHALHSVEWRGGDTIQLIFLVADAPPHLDYEQDYDYAVEMIRAAERGIKIFPIASSGLDDQGEYIFRQLAQFTQGRFIFLTYEGPTNSGAPGDTTTHHVDDYTVDNLDSLLVKLVREELAYQNPQVAQAQ